MQINKFVDFFKWTVTLDITMTSMEFYLRIVSFSENLKNFAYSLTSDYHEANDLVQDTYLKAMIHKDKFEPDSNLKAWIFTIMKNTYINKYRKEKRVHTIMDNTKEHHYFNFSNHSSIVSPDSKYNLSELERILGDINDEKRIPFHMHFQGYKYKEIADAMNLSIGTVKSRIFFCRKSMMEKLKDFQN